MATSKNDKPEDQKPETIRTGGESPPAGGGEKPAGEQKPRETAAKRTATAREANEGLTPLDGTPHAERNRSRKAEAGEKVESDRDLAAAPLDSPRAKSIAESTESAMPIGRQAPREGVRMLVNATRITNDRDEAPDVDKLFTGPDGAGHYVVTERLIQHSTATMYDRPVRNLLLGRGTQVSAAEADMIRARLKAQDVSNDEGEKQDA